MSALISSIVAFIVAGLAILGLVPHQQIQPVPQISQQAVQQTIHAAVPTSTPAPTQTSPISVPGMSKYTDSDFGFSFWYPSGWTVEDNGTGAAGGPGTMYGDGVVKKWFDVGDGKVRLTISEIYSSNRSVSINSAKVGMQSFYFDTDTHTWMVTGDSVDPSPQVADVSVNTMGGLHMLLWGGTFGQNYLVPLNAHNFVYISGNGDIESKYLISTIVATDPSVATPVSTDEQIKTIQAEKDAYAGQ